MSTESHVQYTYPKEDLLEFSFRRYVMGFSFSSVVQSQWMVIDKMFDISVTRSQHL